VRNGDKRAFDDLIAPGAEEILSFAEMRDYCSRPPIDFAWGQGRGRAIAFLRDASGAELVRRRISTYSTPEDTIVESLGAVFMDRFSRDSVVRIGSRTGLLKFEDVTREGENLSIRYRLEEAAATDTGPPLLAIPDAFIEEALKEIRRHPGFRRQLVGIVPIVVKGGRAIAYWHENGSVARFSRENSELPKIYGTSRGILSRIARLRDPHCEESEIPEGAEIHAALWVHPDANVEPIDKYLLMTGKHFQGCPRR